MFRSSWLVGPALLLNLVVCYAAEILLVTPDRPTQVEVRQRNKTIPVKFKLEIWEPVERILVLENPDISQLEACLQAQLIGRIVVLQGEEAFDKRGTGSEACSEARQRFASTQVKRRDGRIARRLKTLIRANPRAVLVWLGTDFRWANLTRRPGMKKQCFDENGSFSGSFGPFDVVSGPTIANCRLVPDGLDGPTLSAKKTRLQLLKATSVLVLTTWPLDHRLDQSWSEIDQLKEEMAGSEILFTPEQSLKQFWDRTLLMNVVSIKFDVMKDIQKEPFLVVATNESGRPIFRQAIMSHRKFVP
jgi:hypothetical protein